MFLATLLARLSPRKMLQKVVPIKKLVTLLNATDSATPLAQRQRVKTATTLLLIVCSDAQKPGCIACSRRSTNRPVIHQGQGATACACTAYLELLSYESQLTRSLVSHGHLDEAFEVCHLTKLVLFFGLVLMCDGSVWWRWTLLRSASVDFRGSDVIDRKHLSVARQEGHESRCDVGRSTRVLDSVGFLSVFCFFLWFFLAWGCCLSFFFFVLLMRCK